MDDNPINLENILEQAPKWTFAGDFTLLEWMKQISQNLESRATKTTEALAKLDNNIKSTNIALDNVANSLTTLQFGNQFVECRVQDDDETLISTNEPNKNNENQCEEPTSKELLITFLNYNLKVLRNCYEKYSIDLEDSDDEENSQEKTCIYQPINPYNKKPLPYIFGSKDWHSKWHVGLYESQQENTYSGDEISEAFSESSSTSHLDDNESFESNTEWASSNSIDNDNLNTNIEVKNASSLRGSQPLYPGTALPINSAKSKGTLSESSSVSTTSSFLAKKSLQTAKQTENLTEKSESINSISSKNSSKPTAKVLSIDKENALQYTSPTEKFIDLFAEPPEDLPSTSSSISSVSNIIQVSDDSRVVGKVNSTAFKPQPPPFVDLFAEPPEDVISSATSKFSNQNITRKTVNLFDEVEDEMNKDDMLTVLTKDDDSEKSKFKERPVLVDKPSAFIKTSKSLFDDSDDDDDFLKAFVRKSSAKEFNKSSLTKTLLFDNDIQEPTVNLKSGEIDVNNDNIASVINTNANTNFPSNKMQNIFDDTEDNDDVLLTNKTTSNETKIPTSNQNVDNNASQLENTTVPVANLSKEPIAQDLSANNTDNLSSKKVNLFDDLNNEDNLFSTKPERDENNASQTSIKDGKEETTTKGDDFDNISKNLSKNKSDLQPNNSMHNEEQIKPNEVVRNGHTVPQTVDTKINENKINTESLRIDEKEKLFETSKQAKNHNKSSLLTQDSLASARANIPEKPISSNKYDFNSILFLDEPPEDDDEFFETLAKTPSTVNSNYNTIDLENDIYEPKLQKVPAASTSNNQTDTTENFYSSLQLFSDTPPDDDAGGSDISNFAPDVNQTKRLHSVFYDDFNETLMALNQQHTEKEIESHSIFSDEPPSMNELTSSSGNDIIDHKVPDDKQEIINSDPKTSEFSNKRPISKLQIPNININIQALLPGANNTLRKVKEDIMKSNVIHPYNDDKKPDLNISKASASENEVTFSKTHLKEAPRTAETEHILPNVTKNRVKAPATRRPSTRRARQENYRKSLMEQQQSLESVDEITEAQNENTFKETKSQVKPNIPQTSVMHEEPNNTLDVQTQLPTQVNDNLRRNNPANAKQISATSKISTITESDALQDTKIKDNMDSTNNFKGITVKRECERKQGLLLFEDEEEDDDFFTHIKTSNISNVKEETNDQEHIENIPTKSSLEVCETNASTSSLLLSNNTNIETTKVISVTQVASEVAHSKGTIKAYETNQPNPVVIASKVKTSTTSSTTKKFKSFLDSEDDDDDLFKTTLQQPSRSDRNKDRSKIAKSQFKSFLDSETDEESIVAVPQKTISTQNLSKISSTKTPKVSILMPKNSNSTLFSDSETDSDDLFGKLSSHKVSNNKNSTESTLKTQTKAEQPQSSLFGDESDSDDFLASSSIVSKNTASKNALKKNVPKTTTQTNTSLFSDLDDSDEDDLFGGAAGKVKPTNVTNIQNIKAPSSTSKTTASVADTPISKTVDDNPLADLL